MPSKRKRWDARVSLGRDAAGKQKFYWIGRFDTKREAVAAKAKARVEKPWEAKPTTEMTGDELADRYLARYAERNKASSYDTARQSLSAFRSKFGARPVASITPVNAEDWAGTVKRSAVPQVRAMFDYAVRLELVPRNPFTGLAGGRGRGRADQDPPTEAELAALRDACDVLGSYGAQFRDLLDFAGLTLMRPGELFELRHTDIDIASNRITVARRLYRGRLDTPKNGRTKVIALVPPAREILLRQPTRARADGLVFVSKMGQRLTAPTVCQYWAVVRAAAGITRPMAFYVATKHWGVSRLYRLGLSARAIGAQAGWSERSVEAMLAVYGHVELAGLAEVDALYAREGEVVGAVRLPWDDLKTNTAADAATDQRINHEHAG